MTVADLARSIRQTLVEVDAKLGKHALRKLSEACAALIHAGSVNTSLICGFLWGVCRLASRP